MTDLSRRLDRRLLLAVFLLSFGVLLSQVALNRIFSFTVWYHFAYISISLALLGFGASGAMLAAYPGLGTGSLHRKVAAYAALSAFGTVAMLLWLGTVRVSPFSALESATEAAKLVAMLAVTLWSFLFAGLAITLTLREAGDDVHRLYFWDLVGAGLGCLLVVPCLDLVGAPGAVLVVALVFAAAGLVAAGGLASGAGRLCLAAVATAALCAPLLRALPFPPSSDKDISRFGTMGFQPLVSHWGSLFRTDILARADREMRGEGYAGLGLAPNYEGPTPAWRMIVHDGGAGAILYLSSPDENEFDMFRHHILSIPYAIAREPALLVIGVGGGADIANAVVHQAKSIDGVELDPDTVRLISHDFEQLTHGYVDHPSVKLHVGEGRHFVRSSEDRFDLIQITGVDTLSALSSGAYVLAENYLYTTEAFGEFFSRLRPGGMLSICSADFHPRTPAARHAPRFAALSVAALRASGIETPSDHILIVGSSEGVALFEILTRPTSFSPAEVESVAAFADANGFETWYLPGHPERSLDAFRRIIDGSAQEQERYLAGLALDLDATTDDAPFFFSVYRWANLFSARKEIDQGHSLATGQLVLVFLLVVATVLSVVTLLVPLVRTGGVGAGVPGRYGYLSYFGCLGAGFIFLEISLVQRFILFLGYPTYALTVLLFALLTSAAVGAWASGRLPDDPRRVLPTLLMTLAIVISSYQLGLSWVFATLIGTSLAVRVAISLVLVAPLGLVLGTFFPFGVRMIARLDRELVPWAWAVNGCLTVIGSVATIILAMTWGFAAVTLGALGIYAVGVGGFLWAASPVRTTRRGTA